MTESEREQIDKVINDLSQIEDQRYLKEVIEKLYITFNLSVSGYDLIEGYLKRLYRAPNKNGFSEYLDLIRFSMYFKDLDLYDALIDVEKLIWRHTHRRRYKSYTAFKNAIRTNQRYSQIISFYRIQIPDKRRKPDQFCSF